MNLLDELTRRKVLQTAAIYVAIAWGATEIVIAIRGEFELEPWVSQLTLIAFVVGFPVTLFASWFVDVTASGFRATTPGKPLGAKSVGVLVIVTVAATGMLWLLIRPPPAGLPDCPATDPFCSASTSLAVLPFANLTGDDGNDYIASGLADDLIATLARLGELRLAAGRSAAIAASQDLTIAGIGEALGVENVLEGRLQPGDEGPVIVAQLINSESENVYWTQPFSTETGLLATREALATAVADALKIGEVGANETTLAETATGDKDAYEAYLKGLQARRVFGYGSAEPLQHFTRAVNLDPWFAAAHVALASIYVEMANSGGINTDEAFTKATAATERAIEINPRLPAAYVMQGQLQRRGTRTGDAEQSLMKALALNPNDETAHLELARLLSNQGRLAIANRELEIAYSLDPLNPLLNTYRTTVLQYRGEYPRAITLLKNQLAADPQSAFIYGNLQILTLVSGAPEASLEYAAAAEKDDALADWNFAFRSIAESRLGLHDAARQSAQVGIDTNPANFWVRIASAMRLLADGDAAALREYGESLMAGGANRHWRKWTGLGALLQRDYIGAAEYLEAAFERRDFVSGPFPAEEVVHMLNLVPAYRGLGDAAKADEWLNICQERIEFLRDQELTLPDLDYAEGALLVLQGDAEDGLELLEKAAMRGWLGWPAMRHDPKLRSLAANPRFEAMAAGNASQR